MPSLKGLVVFVQITSGSKVSAAGSPLKPNDIVSKTAERSMTQGKLKVGLFAQSLRGLGINDPKSHG